MNLYFFIFEHRNKVQFPVPAARDVPGQPNLPNLGLSRPVPGTGNPRVRHEREDVPCATLRFQPGVPGLQESYTRLH